MLYLQQPLCTLFCDVSSDYLPRSGEMELRQAFLVPQSMATLITCQVRKVSTSDARRIMRVKCASEEVLTSTIMLVSRMVRQPRWNGCDSFGESSQPWKLE
jgi:hypothetical protein